MQRSFKCKKNIFSLHLLDCMSTKYSAIHYICRTICPQNTVIFTTFAGPYVHKTQCYSLHLPNHMSTKYSDIHYICQTVCPQNTVLFTTFAGLYVHKTQCYSLHAATTIYLWQVLLFLFMGAMSKNLIHTEIGVCYVAQPYSCRCSTQLFHYNNVRQVSQLWTPILTGDCWTKTAQPTKLTPECLQTNA
jgi:hypothetical protein